MLNDHKREPYFERHKNTKIALLSLLFIITLVLGLATYAAAKLERPLADDAPIKNITIKSGMSTKSIAKLLQQNTIIGSDKVFLYYALIKRANRNIQAGEYELSGSMSIPELVEKLTSGKVVANEVHIRIGEGWTIAKIGEEVEKSGLGKKQDLYDLTGTGPAQGSLAASSEIVAKYDFLKDLPKGASLEGYLFPDTYTISRTGGADELVNKMLKNFEAKVTPEVLSGGSRGNQKLSSIMTVASLIEGEVGRNITDRTLTVDEVDEITHERYIVSQIFWTRLDIGMGMESDATISYALGKPTRQATFADLEVKSPYNTYKNVGLPPGPINNPGLDAIKAAANPANTDYIYFLSDPNGKAYFARTLKEQNDNRKKYLPLR
jgi:UPF0755 protein